MHTPGTARRTGGRVALAVLCAAQLMLIVDVVVVNVALPSIKTGLTISDARLPWTSIAYTLAFGSLLVVAGRAGDLYGRRRLLLAGLALFTLASLLSGLAQEGWHLFAARALQGIGAAAVSPNALATLTATYAEGPVRNRALGFWGAVGSAGAIAGQVLGGLLTDLAGWRWIFLINLPLGLVALLLALRYLPESRAGTGARLDLAGAALLSGALAALILALTRLAEERLDTRLAVMSTLALLLLLAFVAVERRQRAPLVRFGLFHHRGVRTGNTLLALNAGAVGGALFFTSLYLQLSLGYSPLAVGLAFAPVTLIVLAISPLAGRLVARLGVYPLLLAGALVAGPGLLVLARVPQGGAYFPDVFPGLALLALGSGLAYAPTFIAGTAGIGPEEQGLASGLLSTAQELGAALGLALLASLATVVAGGTAGDLAGYRAGFLGALGLTLVGALLAAVAWQGERRASTAAAARAPRGEPAGRSI